jgi:hypothetical protein
LGATPEVCYSKALCGREECEQFDFPLDQRCTQYPSDFTIATPPGYTKNGITTYNCYGHSGNKEFEGGTWCQQFVNNGYRCLQVGTSSCYFRYERLSISDYHTNIEDEECLNLAKCGSTFCMPKLSTKTIVYIVVAVLVCCPALICFWCCCGKRLGCSIS